MSASKCRHVPGRPSPFPLARLVPLRTGLCPCSYPTSCPTLSQSTSVPFCSISCQPPVRPIFPRCVPIHPASSRHLSPHLVRPPRVVRRRSAPSAPRCVGRRALSRMASVYDVRVVCAGIWRRHKDRRNRSREAICPEQAWRAVNLARTLQIYRVFGSFTRRAGCAVSRRCHMA